MPEVRARERLEAGLRARMGASDQKLKASIKVVGSSFSGPLTKPDEPWHYDYAPPPAATAKPNSATRQGTTMAHAH